MEENEGEGGTGEASRSMGQDSAPWWRLGASSCCEQWPRKAHMGHPQGWGP